MTSMKNHNTAQRGATTVEYAIIVALVVVAVLVGAWLLVDPRPDRTMNSPLPYTFNTIGSRVGQFGTVAE